MPTPRARWTRTPPVRTTASTSGGGGVGTTPSLSRRTDDTGYLEYRHLHGAWWSAPVGEYERTRHMACIVQHFEYINSDSYEYGGQSIGPGHLLPVGVRGVGLGVDYTTFTRESHYKISIEEFEGTPLADFSVTRPKKLANPELRIFLTPFPHR